VRWRICIENISPNAVDCTVIPAEAGIQSLRYFLDPGFRRGDDLKTNMFRFGAPIRLGNRVLSKVKNGLRVNVSSFGI
jgi:hypothetical protein